MHRSLVDTQMKSRDLSTACGSEDSFMICFMVTVDSVKVILT